MASGVVYPPQEGVDLRRLDGRLHPPLGTRTSREISGSWQPPQLDLSESGGNVRPLTNSNTLTSTPRTTNDVDTPMKQVQEGMSSSENQQDGDTNNNSDVSASSTEGGGINLDLRSPTASQRSTLPIRQPHSGVDSEREAAGKSVDSTNGPRAMGYIRRQSSDNGIDANVSIPTDGESTIKSGQDTLTNDSIRKEPLPSDSFTVSHGRAPSEISIGAHGDELRSVSTGTTTTTTTSVASSSSPMTYLAPPLQMRTGTDAGRRHVGGVGGVGGTKLLRSLSMASSSTDSLSMGPKLEFVEGVKFCPMGKVPQVATKLSKKAGESNLCVCFFLSEF